MGAAAFVVSGVQARSAAVSGSGTSILPVAMIAEVESQLGTDRVILTGWVEAAASEPRLEDGRSVFDVELTQAQLVGASALGVVQVGVSPQHGQDQATAGEVRALAGGDQFPATSFIDLYLGASAPSSPFGALTLHNEDPLRLTPGAGGQSAPIEAWPPLGVTYRSGSALAGGGCVPLVNVDGSEPTPSLCVLGVEMQFPPVLASYSVGRNGPSDLDPAIVYGLRPAAPAAGLLPYERFSCETLGLSVDGCDGGADGDRDSVDALSFGADLASAGPANVSFSVGPGAMGGPGSAVEGQRLCPPADPGLAPEPEPDVFASGLDGTNELVLDGNGPIGACAPAFPLGFVEGPLVRDDLDGLDSADASTVDADNDGVPELPVYLSLDGGSPSLGELGVSAGDILRTANGAPPAVYASAATLGLGPSDDVDALCLRESGDGVYSAGDDALFFSLAAGSPALAAIAAAPGDLLAPAPLRVVVAANDLGLATGDDADALACGAIPERAGDVDCDGDVNSVDALLVLQYNSLLIETLPCFGGADADGNGGVDSADAAYILQFHAGLIVQLPLATGEER